MKHILMRIALAMFGLILIAHGLIHLGIIPGGMPGPDGKTGWSGQSWLLDHVLNASAIHPIGVVLVAGTILFFIVGGLGLFGIPLLKRWWKATTAIACILSLLLFTIAWTGILPHPTDAIWGPIISGVVLVGLLIDLFREHTVLRPKSRLLEHGGTLTHSYR